MTTPALAVQWRDTFWRVVQQAEHANPLREAAQAARLGDWTTALTNTVIASCAAIGWRAAARGHRLNLLPIPRDEYLSLDVVAFLSDANRWKFPIALLELENSPDTDRIAYALWKVICVRAPLRIVFCYRKEAALGASLVQAVGTAIIGSLALAERARLDGETVIVVGSRADAAQFPYGYFKWWQLNINTGRFELMR